uniref:Uncharacterized protein n=1 Tax=Vitis vinifera TaxID=29760 RepID=A5B4M8_VITVI|nr:hypothetical protein VITISV_015757 [Vitis vinifera]
MEAEQNPGGEVLATTPGFKPKNAGSLIPKEKKLVKKMMWEQMVASVAVLLPTSSAGERETEKQSEVEAEQKPGEEMVTEPPMFETKNTESLIPKKRKLVKTMMLEDMMDSIATLLANCWGGGEAEPPKRAKHTAGKNGKKIFPVQP